VELSIAPRRAETPPAAVTSGTMPASAIAMPAQIQTRRWPRSPFRRSLFISFRPVVHDNRNACAGD
jgi:hypothetical protein